MSSQKAIGSKTLLNLISKLSLKQCGSHRDVDSPMSRVKLNLKSTHTANKGEIQFSEVRWGVKQSLLGWAKRGSSSGFLAWTAAIIWPLLNLIPIRILVKVSKSVVSIVQWSILLLYFQIMKNCAQLKGRLNIWSDNLKLNKSKNNSTPLTPKRKAKKAIQDPINTLFTSTVGAQNRVLCAKSAFIS